MDNFVEHTGIAVPWIVDNVDTDQIMPKQFLTRIERTGYGEFLFHDLRFDENGEKKEDFILNDARYKDASILIAGKNFGCGSSREHAPWGLFQYGFRVILAESFADIFKNNCYKNGLLPVDLTPEQVSTLAQSAKTSNESRITVNLETRAISDTEGFKSSFEIDDFNRTRLLKGLDDIGLTEQHVDLISAFEKQHFA